MNIQFCKNCENLLYIYREIEDDNKLYYACKACSNKEEFKNNTSIYDSTSKLDKSEQIKNNKWLIYDITLPTIVDNPNIQCPNEDCEKRNKIKFIKYDFEDIKYIYICDNCNTKWNNI